MPATVFTNATLMMPDRLLPQGSLVAEDGRIKRASQLKYMHPPAGAINLEGMYLAPGFLDLHVHGGDGADFMDGTPDAFRTVCRAHARHGTTALLATTTVARHEQHLAFLRTCRALKGQDTGGAVVLGAHFYGPYFAGPARGCHPGGPVRAPRPEEYADYLAFADCIRTATV